MKYLKNVLLVTLLFSLFTKFSSAFGCSEKSLTGAREQYELAFKYYNKQDYQQAFNWFKKSAEQGYAPAQYNLGGMYDNGNGVKQDYAQAVYWYEKSAKQGYAPAQYNLGYMYCYGNGVNQDYQQAFNWYKKSAAQNYQPGVELMKEEGL